MSLRTEDATRFYASTGMSHFCYVVRSLGYATVLRTDTLDDFHRSGAASDEQNMTSPPGSGISRSRIITNPLHSISCQNSYDWKTEDVHGPFRHRAEQGR